MIEILVIEVNPLQSMFAEQTAKLVKIATSFVPNVRRARSNFSTNANTAVTGSGLRVCKPASPKVRRIRSFRDGWGVESLNLALQCHDRERDTEPALTEFEGSHWPDS
jgi:hypothetical protein